TDSTPLVAGAYNNINLLATVTDGTAGRWEAALLDGQRVSAYISDMEEGTKLPAYTGAVSGTVSYNQVGLTATVTGTVGAGVLGMVILNPGASFADFDAADIYDYQIIKAPAETTEPWSYSLRYTMPDSAPAGDYPIGLISDTGALTGESFVLKIVDMSTLVADFAGVTADNFLTLAEAHEGFFSSAFLAELQAAEAETGTIGESFMLAKEGFTEGLFDSTLTDWSQANTIAAAAEAALVVDASLAEAENIAATIAAHGATIPVVFESPDYNAAEFVELLPSVLDNVTVTDADSLLAAYNRTIALSLIAGGTAAEKEKAISDYSDALGISADTLNTTHATVTIASKLSNDISAVKTLYADDMDAIVAGIITDLDTPDDTTDELGTPSKPESGRGNNRGSVASIPRDPTVTLLEAPVDTQASASETTDTQATDFVDLAGYDWAKADIAKLVACGVIAGQGDGTFNPEGLLTREQSVKMLVLCLGLATDQNYNGYLDCTMGAWYYPYITTALANGLVNGISRTEFGLGRQMTREDLAVTIYRALLKYGAANDENIVSFSDEASISDYAKDAAGVLGGMGIITGFSDGSFGPKEPATRAQAAAIYSRFIDVIDAARGAKEAQAK
ncbi:MAG: S-layer homology domain-containing protein, partial [Ruminococcaceae bacterium]|nr:S-layer homology domain-containing protein [Oscillospiraceae bacterium]